MRPSAASTRITRLATPCTVSYFLPGKTVIFVRRAGTSVESWLPVAEPRAARAARTASSASASHWSSSPFPSSAQMTEQCPALLGGDGTRGGRIDVRGEFGGDGEERAPHGEQPDQRHVLVQGLLHGSDARVGEACAGGEEDGRGVGGVQCDDRVGDRHRCVSPYGRGQQMAAAEPDAALLVTDPVHDPRTGPLVGCRAVRAELEPHVGGREAEPLVEAVGIGAGGVGGQLHQLAVLAPGFVDRPLDEPGAQAAAALVGVDAYAFDDRAGRAAPGQPGDDRELEGADDTALAYGDDQVLVRVAAEPLEGGEVRGRGRPATRAGRPAGRRRASPRSPGCRRRPPAVSPDRS